MMTTIVCRIDQFFRFCLIHTRQVDVQFSFNTETRRQRADADFAFNKGLFWHGDFVATGNKFHGAKEAGGVTRSEQLFRVGGFTTRTAHLFWYAQFHIQNAVGRGCAAITASGCGSFGGVDNFF
jgi:hypothetical protein